MEEKITFSQLCTLVSSRVKLPQKRVEDFLRELFSMISGSLTEGETVKLKGIGTFKIQKVGERKSVNVTTGKEFIIPEHNKVVFLPSKELAAAVNAPFEAFEAVEISDSLTNEEIDGIDETTPIEGEEVSSAVIKEVTPAVTKDKTLETETLVSTLPEASESEVVEECVIEQIVGGEKDQTEEEQKEHMGTPFAESDLFYDVTERESVEEDSLSETEPPVGTKEEDSMEAPVETPVETPAEISVESPVETTSEIQEEEKPGSVEDGIVEESTSMRADETVQYEDESDQGIPEVIDNQKEYRKHHKFGFIFGFVSAFALIAAVFIVLLFCFPVLYDAMRGQKSYVAETEKTEQVAKGVAPTAVHKSSSITPSDKAEANKENLAPATQPSDNLTKEEDKTESSAQPVYDTISKTRYLTTMAKEHYGNYHFWPYIYKENESFLGHPDRIKPGTRVVVPSLSKYGVDPGNKADERKAKQLGIEIYKKYK